jgi:iron complex transport system substrate-binding protein
MPVLRTPALLLTSALLFTACAGSKSGTDDPGKSVAAGYPVTIDNCGNKVTLRSAPKRAVSLNQGTTEILLSLGLADRMAGTATWTDPVMKGLEKAGLRRPSRSDPRPRPPRDPFPAADHPERICAGEEHDE